MQSKGGQFYLLVNGHPVRVEERVFEDSQKFKRQERRFYELTHGKLVYDSERNVVGFIPPKELSLESLLEKGYQFEEPSAQPLDDDLIKEDLLDLLHEALLSLTDEEWSMIQELYYLGKTEREVGESLNIPKSTIHHRKKAILLKLKDFVERFF